MSSTPTSEILVINNLFNLRANTTLEITKSTNKSLKRSQKKFKVLKKYFYTKKTISLRNWPIPSSLPDWADTPPNLVATRRHKADNQSSSSSENHFKWPDDIFKYKIIL